MNYESASKKDPQLWRMAKRRAIFKYNVGGYIIMSFFFWTAWFFTGERMTRNGWPWPIWPMIVWGAVLLFHFFRGYVYQDGNATEREYERMRRDQNK